MAGKDVFLEQRDVFDYSKADINLASINGVFFMFFFKSGAKIHIKRAKCKCFWVGVLRTAMFSVS